MAGAIYQTKLTADTTQHDQALSKSAKQVLNYKQSCDKADKGVNSLLGSFKKMVPVLGAATIASNLFKSALANNTEAADNFGTIMQTCKSITNEFAYALTSADFSNMYNGLGNIISRAKEYYNELDKLQTLQINLMGANAKLDAELAEARRKVKEGDLSAVEDIKRIGEQQLANMRAEQEQIKRTLEAGVRDATSYTVSNSGSKAEATIDWDMEKLKDYTQNLSKLDAEIHRAKTAYMELAEKAKEYNDENVIHYDAAKAEAYYRALERLRKRYSDDDNLKKFNEGYAQYWRLEQQYNQTQQRNLRYLKEATEKQDTKPTTGSIKVKVDPVLPEGSIAALEKKIQELRQQYNLATTDDDRNILLEKIQMAEEELKKMKLSADDMLPDGSMADLEKKLSELKAEWRLATSDDMREQIKKSIDEIQAEIDRMNGVVIEANIEPAKGSEAYIRKKIAELNTLISNTNDSEAIIQYKIDIEKFQDQLDRLADATQTPMERLKKQIEDLQQAYEDWGDAIDSIFGTAGNSLKSLANTDDEVTNRVLSNTGTLISQLGSLIPKILAVVGAKQAEALASGVAGAAAIGWPQNIGAISSIVAELMAVFATISSLLNGYASGGIFEGYGPKYGDMHIARVNPGEMILNETQQAQLFRMLNGSVGIQQGVGGGHVEFHISGTDLVGVLSNYDRTRSRVR